MSNFEIIKNMSLEELAEFLTKCISDELTHDIGCYQCIDYGTHHWRDGDCEKSRCEMFPIGLDVKKWLLANTLNSQEQAE